MAERNGARKRNERDPLRLLAGIDFSRHSLAALEAARDLARRTGASLTIAHVRPSSDIRAAVQENRGDLLQMPAGKLRREIDAHYESKLEGLRLAGESTKLLRGPSGAQLVREASRGYDYLVVGSRGLGSVAAALIGSTAQEALHSSPIPVLVFPSRS